MAYGRWSSADGWFDARRAARLKIVLIRVSSSSMFSCDNGTTLE